MIITGVICLLIAPENLSTAALLFGVVFLMFIGRVSAKLLVLIGGLTSVGVIAVTFLLMTKNSDIPFLHQFDTWRARIEKFTNDEGGSRCEVRYRQRRADSLHASPLPPVMLSAKAPAIPVQRDFLARHFPDFIFANYH